MSRFTEQHAEAMARHLLAVVQSKSIRLENERKRVLGAVEVLAGKLRSELNTGRIWVIGSLDAPWFHETSDVDLVVEGLSEQEAVSAERHALEILGRRVDLLRFEALDPSFRETVLQEGRLLP